MFDGINTRREQRFQRRGHILIGVTSPQTCVVLPDRLRALREAGFRVSLLSSPGELLDQTGKQAGAETYAIPMQRGISPVSDCIALLRIWRLIRRLKPDLVEFSTPKAGFLGSIAACLSGVPARIYLLRGLKLETAAGIKRLLLLAAEQISARCAQVVVCNSRSLRQQAKQFGIAPESKLLVLGGGSSNGVDTSRFRPAISRIREQLGIPQDARVVGFVGRLTRDKGIPELLQAFSLLLHREPDARLLLVGWFDDSEDALDRGMRERIARHPRAVHTGFVHDTARFYLAMDVLVLPSWREGFPNVVLEAAASGVPAVVTNCTGSRDAVIPGVTGLLVQPGDPEAICEAVASLLQDAERHRSMANAARAWVAENYDSRRVLAQMVAFYNNLISSAAEQVAPRTEAIGETATDLSVWR